ncbi:MAG: hypothetical protein ACLU38_03785 [Dysosmobacter sp.]
MPRIAGLLAGVRFVRRQGTQTILRHEHALTCRTAESLRRLPGVEVFAHPAVLAQAGWCRFRDAGAGRGDRGRSAGAAGDRGAGRAALRAAGPPHRRDAGHLARSGSAFPPSTRLRRRTGWRRPWGIFSGDKT